MSNIKLSGHTWDTSGIYDAEQEKTQKEVNADVSELKTAITQNFPIEPESTNLFENINYGVPSNVEFTHNWCDSYGQIKAGNGSTNSLIVNVEPNTTYYFRIPLINRTIGVETSESGFVLNQIYPLLSFTQLNADSNANITYFTTGASTRKVFIYFYSGSYDYETYKGDIYFTKNTLMLGNAYLKEEYLKIKNEYVVPAQTSFFSGVNYFNPLYANLNYAFFGNTGDVSLNANTYTVVFPVEPSTKYFINIPDANRCNIGEVPADTLMFGVKVSVLIEGGTYPCEFTTSASAKFVAVYFNSGSYDYESNKYNIVLCKNKYVPQEYVNPKYLNGNIANANILIFGDSITDCCSITINSSNETTAYSWRNPSNSYTDAGGNTVNYSMWPKILKDNQPCGEIRNYAFSGASYKTQTRTSGYERQNLQYQIDVALNDKDNPNNVFTVDDFAPDIVIFALGTNEGTPADTYEEVMADTVASADGTINVESTLSELDDTKTIGSARKAFMRIKQAFPMAQLYCVLPIQRADNETNWGDLRTYLKQMAERYGCIIIDGTADSGITRDFNVWNDLGAYLKDGLHPNEKGQNLMARMIISSLRTHFMPFGTGFNT